MHQVQRAATRLGSPKSPPRAGAASCPRAENVSGAACSHTAGLPQISPWGRGIFLPQSRECIRCSLQPHGWSPPNLPLGQGQLPAPEPGMHQVQRAATRLVSPKSPPSGRGSFLPQSRECIRCSLQPHGWAPQSPPWGRGIFLPQSRECIRCSLQPHGWTPPNLPPRAGAASCPRAGKASGAACSHQSSQHAAQQPRSEPSRRDCSPLHGGGRRAARRDVWSPSLGSVATERKVPQPRSAL
ncbi:uncharacterized protein [Petaurus breviceps papuanus]|uniref:uncharacterized protein n=1 Tax=Petaurus breviceps papuanus TaxID=3040969 RepID=UPI0036DE8AF1